MNEEAKTDAPEETPNAEWPEGDARWLSSPQLPERNPKNEPPRLFGRGECPFVPLKDYVVLWVKPVEFYTRSGLIVATQTGGPGGYECPVLTVVSVGPDAADRFAPGDTVVANPRNAEVTYEWSDPEGLSTEHFLFVKAENVIGHMDQEIVSQFSIRAQRCRDQLVKQMADAKAAKDADLTVPEEKKIVGLDGQPVDPQTDG